MFSQDLELKLKSSGPARRAGLDLSPVGQWAVHALVVAGIDGLKRLLALVEDPKVDVKLRPAGTEGDDGWHVPTVDEIRDLIAGESQAVELVITPALEQGLRDVAEATIRAIREGRMPAPALDEVLELVTHIDQLDERDRSQGELDLTGAWAKGVGDTAVALRDVLSDLASDADDQNTREPLSSSKDGAEAPDTAASEAPPSEAGQNAGADTAPLSETAGVAEGQAQVATSDPAPAPAPATAPTPTETDKPARKPGRQK